MEQYREPSYGEICEGLHLAAFEFIPFALACCKDTFYAESVVLDVFSISLENSLFYFSEKDAFTYRKFRVEIFALIWEQVQKSNELGIYLSKEISDKKMYSFFQLPLLERGVLFLRTRMHLSYMEICRIVSIVSKEQAEEIMQNARKKILGKDLVFKGF